MARRVEPSLDGNGQRIAIVVARFNSYVTQQMAEVCAERLLELGVDAESISVTEVPGSVELPLVARTLATRADIDAVIAIGAVIRGETAHFEHVANMAADGLARAAEQTGKPVIFGVLTTFNTEQAVARIPHAEGYADAAVEMVNTSRALGDL